MMTIWMILVVSGRFFVYESPILMLKYDVL